MTFLSGGPYFFTRDTAAGDAGFVGGRKFSIVQISDLSAPRVYAM